MMNDASRNEAYQLAIRRAIGNRTNLQVLDLGCGAGLLSMMAARAGAERVTAVEATPILAEMARAVVKRNGYEKQITVHGKWSLDLEVPRDMPEKADLVISEVVNTALIGEGMLKTYNDALERLVKPSAVMIPQAGAVEALLVESPEIERHTRIDAAAGFDLRDFNLFHPADYMQASAHSRRNSTQANPLNSILPPPQYDLRHTDYRPLTDKFRPLVFDFREAHKVHHPALSMRRRAWCGFILVQTLCVSRQATKRVATLRFQRSGRVVAVAYWFILQLDEEVQISLSPELGGRPSPHWRQAVQYLGGIAEVQAGDVMKLSVEHDMQNIHFKVLSITRG